MNKYLTPKKIYEGQAVYNRLMLTIYDLFVLKFSNHLIWKCPLKDILTHYNLNISNNHLDVGVGTGYFLDNCNFSINYPRIALLDINTNCLKATAKRIKRFNPEILPAANILEPLEIPGSSFDSIGINYVLHCLAGSIHEKSVVFNHLKKFLNPGGVIFGSTLLNKGVKISKNAKIAMYIYNNWIKSFHNNDDSLNDFKNAMKNNFYESKIKVIGNAILFSGRI